MSARPILFSGPMVRALLEGRKTQTRRAVKPPRGFGPVENLMDTDPHLFSGSNTDPNSWGWPYADDGAPLVLNAWRNSLCPHGQPGDLLWVRETFYCDHAFYPNGTPPGCYWDGLKRRSAHSPEQVLEQRAEMLEAMYYRADGEPKWEGSDSPMQWRSPIHMPRWASRLTLRITDVRVQRLQDCSHADAVAEGLDHVSDGCAPWGIKGLAASWGGDARRSYAALWESINGPGSWDANPWVWAMTFDVIKANVDQVAA